MGNTNSGSAPSQVPFAQAPQRPHHLQYAYVQAGNQAPNAEPTKGGSGNGAAGGAKRGRGASSAGGAGNGGAKGEQTKADRRYVSC